MNVFLKAYRVTLKAVSMDLICCLNRKFKLQVLDEDTLVGNLKLYSDPNRSLSVFRFQF